MELNERIKNLRLLKLFTQKELGKIVGVSETSIKCWESGTKKPSMQKIISLSTAFEVSTDYLLGVTSYTPDDDVTPDLLLNKSEKLLISNYRMLDKYGKTIVETVCELEKRRTTESQPITETIPTKDKTPYCHTRQIPRYITPIAAGYSVPIDEDEFEMIEIDSSVLPDADFAVKISGNSMFPYINDGDIVYVKRTNELDVGDIGVFCVNGAMYCKQYYIDNLGNMTLVSANPELKGSNVKISSDSGSRVICYGKVLLGEKVPLPKYFI